MFCSNIPQGGKQETGTQEMKTDIITEDAKLNELNCNKSAGPDGLHPRVLLETRRTISRYLEYIFRNSIENEEVVVDWKDKVEKYRPYSVACLL